jgi:putative transposase
MSQFWKVGYIWRSHWIYFGDSSLAGPWTGGSIRQLVIDAFNMAIKNGGLKLGLIHHSDRGIQYASNEFQALLKTKGIVCSMSCKGDCWVNAVAESFFHTLKVELVHEKNCNTRQEAKKAIFEYIEVFYNR